MAIFWGQVVDVPETVDQSEICSVETFFKIVSFNFAGVVDVLALERYKSEFCNSVKEEIGQLRACLEKGERIITELRKSVVDSAEETEVLTRIFHRRLSLAILRGTRRSIC